MLLTYCMGGDMCELIDDERQEAGQLTFERCRTLKYRPSSRCPTMKCHVMVTVFGPSPPGPPAKALIRYFNLDPGGLIKPSPLTA